MTLTPEPPAPTNAPPTAEGSPSGRDHSSSDPDRIVTDTQTWGVGVAAYPRLHDPTLALAADILNDLEHVKISNENRLRQLTRSATDADGEMRGFGLDETHPDVARLASLVASLTDAEHQATLNLQRLMRRHPLGPWVKTQRGIGEKQAARLLATIGDPAVRTTIHDDGTETYEWRTVSQLWAYCGLHTLPGDEFENVAAKRRKGVKSNWSTNAKTRTWLIVQSTMKQLDSTCKTDTGIADHIDGCGCSPYRIAVDERRTHTATTHPEWTPGHSLADGQRIACKRLLRDLWRESRRLHGLTHTTNTPTN